MTTTQSADLGFAYMREIDACVEAWAEGDDPIARDLYTEAREEAERILVSVGTEETQAAMQVAADITTLFNRKQRESASVM